MSECVFLCSSLCAMLNYVNPSKECIHTVFLLLRLLFYIYVRV